MGLKLKPDAVSHICTTLSSYSFDFKEPLTASSVTAVKETLLASEYIREFLTNSLRHTARWHCHKKHPEVEGLSEKITESVLKGSLGFGEDSKFKKLKKKLAQKPVVRLLLSGLLAPPNTDESPLVAEVSKLLSTAQIGITCLEFHREVVKKLLEGKKVKKIPSYYSSSSEDAKLLLKKEGLLDQLRLDALKREMKNYGKLSDAQVNEATQCLLKGLSTFNDYSVVTDRQPLSHWAEENKKVRQILEGVTFDKDSLLISAITKICWKNNIAGKKPQKSIIERVKKGIYSIPDLDYDHEVKKSICEAIEGDQNIMQLLKDYPCAPEDRLVHMVTKLVWSVDADSSVMPIVEAVKKGNLTMTGVRLPLDARKALFYKFEEAKIESQLSTEYSDEQKLLSNVTKYCWEVGVSDDKAVTEVLSYVKRGVINFPQFSFTISLDSRKALSSKLSGCKVIEEILKNVKVTPTDELANHVTGLCWFYGMVEDVTITEIVSRLTKQQNLDALKPLNVSTELISALEANERIRNALNVIRQQLKQKLAESVRRLITSNSLHCDAEMVADYLMEGEPLERKIDSKAAKVIEADQIVRGLVFNLGREPPTSNIQITDTRTSHNRPSGRHIFIVLALELKQEVVKPAISFGKGKELGAFEFDRSPHYHDIWTLSHTLSDEVWRHSSELSYELHLYTGAEWKPEGRDRSIKKHDKFLFLHWNPPPSFWGWVMSLVQSPNDKSLSASCCAQEMIYRYATLREGDLNSSYDDLWTTLNHLKQETKISISGLLKDFFDKYALGFLTSHRSFVFIFALLSGSRDPRSRTPPPSLDLVSTMLQNTNSHLHSLLEGFNQVDASYTHSTRSLAIDVGDVLLRLVDHHQNSAPARVVSFLIYNLPAFIQFHRLDDSSLRTLWRGRRGSSTPNTPAVISELFPVDFSHFFKVHHASMNQEFWNLFIIIFSPEIPALLKLLVPHLKAVSYFDASDANSRISTWKQQVAIRWHSTFLVP